MRQLGVNNIISCHSNTLTTVSCCICRQKRLERLQAAHPETALWTSESLELKQAVGRLCCAKVAAFKLEVEQKQRLHFETRWAQQKIGDVSRKEHQKLTVELLKLAGLLTTALQALLAWEHQRQRYKQHLPGDAAGAGWAKALGAAALVCVWKQESLRGSATKRDALLKASYVWLQSSACAVPSQRAVSCCYSI